MNILEEKNIITQIVGAIQIVTGLSPIEYSKEGRTLDLYYPRAIFIHHCHEKGLTPVKIASIIHRDRTSVLRAISKYDDEMKYNKAF
ncbi:MAG: hypothetical protein PHD21_08715, partial [Flavobacteriales bacterium]|nr:hypothetical protein [Flavobacteriales bacterium]